MKLKKTSYDSLSFLKIIMKVYQKEDFLFIKMLDFIQYKNITHIKMFIKASKLKFLRKVQNNTWIEHKTQSRIGGKSHVSKERLAGTDVICTSIHTHTAGGECTLDEGKGPTGANKLKVRITTKVNKWKSILFDLVVKKNIFFHKKIIK